MQFRTGLLALLAIGLLLAAATPTLADDLPAPVIRSVRATDAPATRIVRASRPRAVRFQTVALQPAKPRPVAVRATTPATRRNAIPVAPFPRRRSVLPPPLPRPGVRETAVLAREVAPRVERKRVPSRTRRAAPVRTVCPQPKRVAQTRIPPPPGRPARTDYQRRRLPLVPSGCSGGG